MLAECWQLVCQRTVHGFIHGAIYDVRLSMAAYLHVLWLKNDCLKSDINFTPSLVRQFVHIMSAEPSRHELFRLQIHYCFFLHEPRLLKWYPKNGHALFAKSTTCTQFVYTEKGSYSFWRHPGCGHKKASVLWSHLDSGHIDEH